MPYHHREITAAYVRLLWPFRIGKPKDPEGWIARPLSEGRYGENLAPLVESLWKPDGREEGPQRPGWRYLTLSSAATPFEGQFEVKSPRTGRLQSLRVAEPGIEVFSSPQGAGVLSLSVSPGDPGPWHADDLLAWISAIHYGPDHPDHPLLINTATREETRLKNVIDACVLAFGREPPPLQRSFTVFSSVQTKEPLDLAGSGADAVGALLVALSRVDDPRHQHDATTPTGVPSVTLHNEHCYAATWDGAAHVIGPSKSTTPPGEGVNAAERSHNRHFLQYLLPLLQLWSIRFTQQRAVEAVMTQDTATATDSLDALRRDVLTLSLQSRVEQVTGGDRATRVFLCSAEALRIDLGLGSLQSMVGELQSSATLRETRLAVKSIAMVQVKVEWIEVFIISVYALEVLMITTEVFHLTESHRGYAALGVFGGGAVAALAALLIVRPWEHAGSHEHGRLVDLVSPRRLFRGCAAAPGRLRTAPGAVKFRLLIVAFLLALLAAYAIVGFRLSANH